MHIFLYIAMRRQWLSPCRMAGVYDGVRMPALSCGLQLMSIKWNKNRQAQFTFKVLKNKVLLIKHISVFYLDFIFV